MELPFRYRIVPGMTATRTGAAAAAAKHAAAIVQIETLDGNGLSLSFPTREAAEIAFRQVRTGSNVQHCALLTHLREGVYASGATYCRG
jgi:cobalamin biosynthesis protein CbiD